MERINARVDEELKQELEAEARAKGLQTPRRCRLHDRQDGAVSTASSTRAATARHPDID
jgi:hypothetical protein